MSVTMTRYTHSHKILTNQGDWNSNTIKLALVLNTYTFDESHTQWSDVSTHEVTSGSGYTTGGATMTCSSTNTMLDADDFTFTNLTKTFRSAVMYIEGTVESITNPLLSYILFDDTPEDIVVSGSDFVITWDDLGVFTLQ